MTMSFAVGVLLGLALGAWAGREAERRHVRRLIDGEATRRDGVVH